MDVPNFAAIEWESPLSWRYICDSDEVPLEPETGSSQMFLLGDTQIAVYRFPDNRVFASHNMCGHRRAFILSEGVLGVDSHGTAHVACPIHRRKFDLEGSRAGYNNSNNFRFSIATFAAKEEDGKIYVNVPEAEEMDAVLGTQRWSTSTTTRPKPSFLNGLQGRSSPMREEKGVPTCMAVDSNLIW